MKHIASSAAYGFMVVLLAFSCKQSDFPLMEAEKKLITDSIRHTLFNYYSDIRSEGLMAEFRYLDNSPEFFWVPPGFSQSISYDSVAAILKKSAPLFKSIDNTWDTLRIDPLSHELATYTGRLRSIVTDTTGHTSETSLIETGVLIKRREGWKLLRGQTSIISH
jgi:hypothetical protein